MATENGRNVNGVELTDITLQNNANNGHCPDGPEIPTTDRGPWTHSSNSYSRKGGRGHSVSKTSLDQRTIIVCGIVCVVVFVVGLALGIVIGVFAVNKGTADEANHVTGTGSLIANNTTFNLSKITSKPSVCATSEPCICTPKATCDCAPCACETTTTKTLPPSSPPPTTTEQPSDFVNMTGYPGQCTICAFREPDESTTNGTSMSVFAPLTKDEINKVLLLMKAKGHVSQGNSLKDNRVSHVYLHPVDKLAALSYLDNGGAFPGRYAKVHVVRGAVASPDIMEYKLGPLNKTNENIQIDKLRTDGEIDFNRRPYDNVERGARGIVVRSHLLTMNRLFRESFDGAQYGSGMATSYDYLPTRNASDRLSLMHMSLSLSGSKTLRGVPVSCIVHHPGTDTSKWYASDFYYLSQGPFESGQALQHAYDMGELRKFKLPSNYRQLHNREFNLELNQSLPKREHSDLPPPRTYEPKGPRYSIKGNVILWMDWEFEYSADPVKGPGIYNIKFKGTRIAYEIALQDVTLIYASQSNGAAPPTLSDTFYFLGHFNSPQIGFDCPERSHILYTTGYIFGYIREQQAACLFEADGQSPIWRHGRQGLVDNYLLIRFPMNLGNYDYSLEWQFHLDGHIETKISASGYLYGAFWDPDDPLVNNDKSSTPFGYRIADYLLGPIHDHAFSFKVDIDILGTKNSFETVHWRGGSVLSALQTQTNVTETPGYFPFNNTRYLEYELLENESGFVLDQKRPKYFTVVNENERNVWGTKRGYRVIPHSSAAEYLEDHLMFGAWEHLKYHIVVTKRKDSEPQATNSLYDLIRPTLPLKGVGNMLNNESVRNEDLVLWVTEKFLHAPSSEDVPMTLQVHRGFSLKPFNYFDRTPTFDVKGHYSPYSYTPYTFQPCYEDV